MNCEVKILLNEKHLTLSELEEELIFKFLPDLQFENEAIRVDIQTKCKEQEISEKSRELGKRFSKEIDTAYFHPVCIEWISESVGHGLFAAETLEEGCFVGEYTGEVRPNERRYFEPLNNYCYEYPVADHRGRNYVIDASMGNLARFINHSSKPNLKPYHVFHGGIYHLILMTLRKVEKGEQLCYHYGPNYWHVRSPPLNL